MVQQLQHQNAILRNQSLATDSSELDDFSACSAVSNTMSSRNPGPNVSEVLSSRANSMSAAATNGPKTAPVTLPATKSSKPSASPLPASSVVELPEEECWLFKSPKGQNSSLSTKDSSLHWAREVFDSPTSQLHRHRYDLLNRLEVILTMNGGAGSSATKPFLFGGSAPSLAAFNLADQDTHASSSSPSIIPGRPEALKSTLCLSAAPPVPSFRRGLHADVNTATFTRPRRQHSETISQRPEGSGQPMNLRASDAAFQPSLYGGTSPADKAPFRASGSCDDLQNVADLQVIARMQEDDLKAQVAAMNAAVVNKNGSQQSLASNRSSTGDPKSASQSPHSSTNRLYQPARSHRTSPNGRTQVPGLGPPRTLLSLRPRGSHGSNDSMNEVDGAGAETPLGISVGHEFGRRGSPSPPLPMRYSPESPGSTAGGLYSLPHAPPPPVVFAATPQNTEALTAGGDSHLPRAVIVGRTHRPLRGAVPAAATRLPVASAKLGGMLIQPRRSQLANGTAVSPQDLKTSSQEVIPQTLPSYAWGDVLPHPSQPLQHAGEHLRYSSEQLDNHAPHQQPYPRPRRIPVPPPRCGSALSSTASINQNGPQ
ncbi:hypothetical protein SprV_0100514900 [Sparganum proliferum]